MDSNQGLNTSQIYSDTDKAAQKLYKACVFSITSQFVGLFFVALYLFYLYKKYFVFSHDLPPSSPTITRSPSFAISVSHLSLENLDAVLFIIIFVFMCIICVCVCVMYSDMMQNTTLNVCVCVCFILSEFCIKSWSNFV